MNHELPDVQAGFRKGRRTRDQIVNICWIIKNAREFQKKLVLYWLCESLWLCGSQQTVGNSSRDGNTTLPVSWEICMQVKKQWLESDMEQDRFQIRKGVCQGCILSPFLFNLYAEDIMRNARLGEAQAGIKISRRNINNLRYADDTTLMAESIRELKSLIWSHHFMANRWGTMETVTDLFFQSPKSLQVVIAAKKLKDACSLENPTEGGAW